MRTYAILSALLAFFASRAVSAETERKVDVFAWPLTASNPQSLAVITYTSTNATVDSYLPLSLKEPLASDDIVRVGFYHKSGAWSGVATSAWNFAPGRNKKLQLHVREDGELYHVAFKTTEGVIQGKAKGGTSAGDKDGLSVEVVKIQKGPVPVLNKPIVVREDGSTDDKEPEKTFLQK